MSSNLTAGDLQIITRIAVFRGLKSETVEHIIAPATAVMLRPHEWIVRQDDPATSFFIVIDGWVKLYRSTPSGDETVIDIMTKGESFAEAVAFTGNRYIATAEAVSEARVARIPADHIVRCIGESPDIALAMSGLWRMQRTIWSAGMRATRASLTASAVAMYRVPVKATASAKLWPLVIISITVSSPDGVLR